MAQSKTFSTTAERWQALVQRDITADGLFIYGVSTTGIYCRPVCPSRLPKRENTQFFDTWQEAEAAGFRPCKRCVPQSPNKPDPTTQAIVKACQIIETAEQPPSLNQLAGEVGLSPYHFHRAFKKRVGVTPKQYAAQKRLDRVQANLQQTETVTEAIYKAGYESSSRFYETSPTALGMKPAQYQTGGAGLVIRFAVVDSYLGWILVAATEVGICKIDFGDTPEILENRLRASFPQADLQADEPTFKAIVAQVLTFLEAPDQSFPLPLDIQGTAFQRRVWTALQAIPAGSTASYAEIAAQIGQPKAARAVAQACAANNIAVAIPCHRVVRSNGHLGGYRWGLERKQALLDREAP